MKKIVQSLHYLLLYTLLTSTQALQAGQSNNSKPLYCEALLYNILQAKKPKKDLYNKLTKSMISLTDPNDSDFIQTVSRFEWSAQELRKEIAQQAIKAETKEQSIEQANTISPLTTDKLKAILTCTAQANNLLLFKKLFHINYHQLYKALNSTQYAVLHTDFFELFLQQNEEAVTWLYCLEKYLKETNFNLLENQVYYEIICFFDDANSVQCIQNKQYNPQPCIKPALFYSAKKVQKQLLYALNNYQLRAIELTTESEHKQSKKIELTLTSYIEKEMLEDKK